MRFLIVDTYYPAFLDSVYASQGGLAQQPYVQQWRALMDQYFGTADFYSANLQKLGQEATEIVANCRPLQMRWAEEHGLSIRYSLQRRTYRGLPFPWLDKDWFYPILLAQVKDYRPDVIHFPDPGHIDAAFLCEIRSYVRLITGQIASPIPRSADFRQYDLMLSSFPHFVERLQQQGLRSAYLNLGFEPRVLQHLKRTEVYDVVFVGGLSSSHAERISFLERVAQGTRVDWWGYGVKNLASNSPLRSTYHGSAWALDMYEKLFNDRIALNHHIDVAENYANNMRLYEATGVGSFLLTDFKDNLHQLFKPGKEVIAYRSPEECVELICYYLKNEEERQTIARTGQERTLREHTYHHRMQEFVEIVGKYL
jgi:hypothetical protein